MYYERLFRPRGEGYILQTMRGQKYVTSSQREQIVASYRRSMKFDLKRIFLIIFVAIIGMIPFIIIGAYFELGKVYIDVIANIMVFLVAGSILIPHINHYRLRKNILLQCKTIPDDRSNEEKRTDNLNLIPWYFVPINLAVGGTMGYFSIFDGIQGWIDGTVFVFGLALVLRTLWTATLKLKART